MLHAVRAVLQRRRRRAVALMVVVALGASVTAAHSSAGDHHMGEAASMCLAVLAVAGAATAALPSLGRIVLDPPRAVDAQRVDVRRSHRR